MGVTGEDEVDARDLGQPGGKILELGAAGGSVSETFFEAGVGEEDHEVAALVFAEQPHLFAGGFVH